MNPETEHNLLMLVTGNVGLAGLHKWAEALQPIFSVLVSIGQVAVAAATVVYIIRKIKSLKTKVTPDEIKKAIDDTDPGK